MMIAVVLIQIPVLILVNKLQGNMAE